MCIYLLGFSEGHHPSFRASAHAACHVVYTTTQFDNAELSLLQIAMIGLVEDARVEALALKRFPGLRQTWLPLHTATPAAGDSAGSLMARLARASSESSLFHAVDSPRPAA